MGIQADIYAKTIRGDALNDIDLAAGVKFWRDLADKLAGCGPVFKLAWKEANSMADTLEGFVKARRGK